MQDIFVGIISCIVGVVFLYAAATNNQFLFDLHKTRWVVKLWGQPAARIYVALLGLVLIVLGAAIIQGWRLPLLG